MTAQNRDTYYMELAFAQAQLANEQKEVPVGAVLVANDQVIAQSHNQVQKKTDATAHAELRVLRGGCRQRKEKYLIDCTLYVTLEPCAMCAMACYWTQIKRLVFAANDDKRGYRLFRPCLLHPRTEIIGGIMAEKSSEIIKLFFQKLR